MTEAEIKAIVNKFAELAEVLRDARPRRQGRSLPSAWPQADLPPTESTGGSSGPGSPALANRECPRTDCTKKPMPAHDRVLVGQRREINAANRVIRWSTVLAVVGVAAILRLCRMSMQALWCGARRVGLAWAAYPLDGGRVSFTRVRW
jgi:hypothetical protein